MPLATSVALTLSELRARLERELPGRVLRIVLFGSVARGQDTDESDLDVLIVLGGAPPYAERAHCMDVLTEIALSRGLVPAPVVLSEAEWDELRRRESLFVTEVERDGIAA